MRRVGRAEVEHHEFSEQARKLDVAVRPLMALLDEQRVTPTGVRFCGHASMQGER
ncbi:hypothetical protein NWF24_14615 [Variovorax paradoxus]|uniref:hypothetical protein n=1 Tax=Variovorax paradoxus TaxID=34073 RepID=UPI0021AD24D7|nr:hypothetical protein [Variovorax paradoxus]UVH60594.1 hypothetical protein NWF24_14615 [Variovorax paradoxus]